MTSPLLNSYDTYPCRTAPSSVDFTTLMKRQTHRDWLGIHAQLKLVNFKISQLIQNLSGETTREVAGQIVKPLIIHELNGTSPFPGVKKKYSSR